MTVMLRIPPSQKMRKRLALTPLIDVIFILVMFFLLSSTFGVWRPLDVSLGAGEGARPQTEPQSQKAPSVLMTIRRGPDQQSAIVRINGVAIDRAGLVDELNRLAAKGATDVLLLPSDDIDFQEVVHLLDLARSSKMARIGMKVD